MTTVAPWDQLPLFEDHPAEAALYAAIAGHRTWHDAAEAAMAYLVRRGEPFSSDDLRDLLDDRVGDPPSMNAYGGLFMSWSRQGLIRKEGGGASRRRKRHGGHRHLWKPA